MADQEKIAQCPFCGGANTETTRHTIAVEGSDADRASGIAVYCRDCVAYGPLYTTKIAAIEAWNKGQK